MVEIIKDAYKTNTTNATNASATTRETNIPLAITIELISLVIILENAVILLTLRLFRKRKLVDILILSLTLADLINVILPLQIINIKANLALGVWSDWLCGLFIWLTYTLRLASLSTVTVMSVEQALMLYQPLRYYTQITFSFVKKLVVIIWLLSGIAAVLPKVLQISLLNERDTERINCEFLPFQIGFEFGIFIEAVGVFQFGIVLSSYIALVTSSKGFLRRQRSMIASQKQRESSGGEIERENTLRRRQNAREDTQGMVQAKQLCRAMGYVVLLYYMTWLPFLIYNLYNLLTRSTVYNNQMVAVVGICSFATPLLNPVLYVKMTSRYRNGFVYIRTRALSICQRNKSLMSDTSGQRMSFTNEFHSSITASSRFILSWRQKNETTMTSASTLTLVTLCEQHNTREEDVQLPEKYKDEENEK